MSVIASKITDNQLFVQAFVSVNIKENINVRNTDNLLGESEIGEMPSKRAINVESVSIS